jgi:hypothetical protein
MRRLLPAVLLAALGATPAAAQRSTAVAKRPAPVAQRPTAVARRPAPVAPKSAPVVARPAPVATRPAAVAAPRPAPPPLDTALDVAGIAAAAVITPKGTTIRTAPDARAIGALQAGATMVPLARERGWVRVRVEGWVLERDVEPADSALRSPLSAADLRADPGGTRGKIVRWEVEVLSLQTADPLRRDFAQDEPYLLVRGPGTETAIVYLAVPPSLLASAKALASRTTPHAVVTARIRNGKSEPLGVPILDLLSIARQ